LLQQATGYGVVFILDFIEGRISPLRSELVWSPSADFPMSSFGPEMKTLFRQGYLFTLCLCISNQKRRFCQCVRYCRMCN